MTDVKSVYDVFTVNLETLCRISERVSKDREKVRSSEQKAVSEIRRLLSNGTSAAELARTLGVSQQYLSDVRHGRRTFGRKLFTKLAGMRGV